jgi:hypothetical protein
MLAIPFDIPNKELNDVSLSLLEKQDVSLYSRVNGDRAYTSMYVDFIISEIENQTRQNPSFIENNHSAWQDFQQRLNSSASDIVEAFKLFLALLEDVYPASKKNEECPICLSEPHELVMPCCKQCICKHCLVKMQMNSMTTCCFCKKPFI